MSAVTQRVQTESLHLWHFHFSPYSEKVRWAFDLKRLSHIRTSLVSGFHIPVARWKSGQTQLPILQVGGRMVSGSARILEEIERLAPKPKLIPDDPEVRAHALALQAHFDGQVAKDMVRLFWSAYFERSEDLSQMVADGHSEVLRVVWKLMLPVSRTFISDNVGLDDKTLAAARTRLRAHFDWLGQELTPSGYLVGDHFSIADLAAASVMSPIVRPPKYPYPLPEPWPPGLVALRNSVSDHPAFQWVQDIYQRHRR